MMAHLQLPESKIPPQTRGHVSALDPSEEQQAYDSMMAHLQLSEQFTQQKFVHIHQYMFTASKYK